VGKRFSISVGLVVMLTLAVFILLPSITIADDGNKVGGGGTEGQKQEQKTEKKAQTAPSTNASQQQQVSIAVLDLTGNGVSKEIAATITEAVLAEISKEKNIKAVGMADIRAMLSLEQEKQLLGCDDASCIAEIGGALGVDRIVSGNIGKVGGTFVMQLKLINIKTAEVIRRVDRTVSGSEERLLSVARALAVELVTGKQTNRVGTLAITVKPKGALVYVDGKAVGITPLAGPLTLEEGAHDIKITKDGFKQSAKQVRITNNTQATLEVALQAVKKVVPKGYVVLALNNPGAVVTVDGKPAGVTPLSKPIVMTQGDHVLRVEKTGMQPWQKILKIKAKDTIKISAELKPLAVEEGPPWDIIGYSLLALSLAAGGGAGYAGYTAFQAHDDYKGAVTKADADKYRKQTEDRALYTDILIGTASVTGAAAILFLILDWTSGPGDSDEKPSAFIAPIQGGAAAGVGWRY